ncbi:Asr1405/Asl0597 family protein [Aphanothece sacrum]|uniref:Uncharacterized protein n=1 Tax=Aphanothece sacrum FPU1 TaxID=1920663 RepID=A0A401INM6_APHSA|nr:Asr1405/Asl0597 family protein [Aphanothece sacrum]GBF82837.1 hypothetical protein AsFPU1_4271 [Aphanothece sacrum FPU1]GBF85928.1 hypothetical protein AsFPU3_2998 [Aphanothece sacrum FPU3]
MNSPNLPLELTQVLQVDWSDRWSVYYRLQELEILCHCSAYKPLQVKLYSATSLIQVWSVIKQHSASREELIDWLNDCWHDRTT